MEMMGPRIAKHIKGQEALGKQGGLCLENMSER